MNDARQPGPRFLWLHALYVAAWLFVGSLLLGGVIGGAVFVLLVALVGYAPT